MCFWSLGAACCCSTGAGGCEARQSSPFVKKGRTKPAAICMMDLYDVDFYSPSGFTQAFAGRHSRWRLPSKWNEMKWNYLSVRRAFVWWGGFGGISREKWDKRDKWWQSAWAGMWVLFRFKIVGKYCSNDRSRRRPFDAAPARTKNGCWFHS